MAGVKLTKRDTFLTRSDFMQLVYACCSPARPGLKDAGDLQVPLPTIWKPQPLWTGKQVFYCPSTHYTFVKFLCVSMPFYCMTIQYSF